MASAARLGPSSKTEGVPLATRRRLNITVMPGVAFFLEGVNLLDATRKENANSVYRRTIIETFGRRVYGGVRLKL